MGNSFSDGFLWMFGAFFAFIVLGLIVAFLYYLGLRTGFFKDVAIGTLKNIIGY